jgi:O-antigen/teichoic acid export membrane protein
MSKKVGLGKLAVLYLVGNLSSRVINFAMFFVYTFYLSKKDIGLYDIIQNSVLLITPVISLQLYDAAFRLIMNETDATKIKKVISSSILVALACVALFTVIYFAVYDYFLNIYGFEIYLLILAQTIFLFFPQFARALNLNNVFVISGVLYTVIISACSFVFLTVFHFNIEGLIIANAIAYFLGAIFVAYKIDFSKYFSFVSYDKPLVKEMLKYSLPLIPGTLSWWVISYSNRYVILEYMDLEANGLFAVAQKLPAILYMITVVFGMAWSEKAISSYDSENKNTYYTDVFTKYFNLIFSIVLVLMSISKPFFYFFVDSSYFESWKLLPMLYIAVVFQSLANFYGTGYTSSKKTSGAFFTTVIGAAVTIVVSFVFIPIIGLYGACLSFLLGYLVMLVTRMVHTRKYFNIDFPVKNALIFAVSIAVCFALSVADSFWFTGINMIFASGIMLFFNKEMIFNYLNKIKAKI